MKHFNMISLVILLALITQTALFSMSGDETTSLLQGDETSYRTNDFIETIKRGSTQEITDYLENDQWVLSTPIETFIQAETIAVKKKKPQLVNKLRQIIQAKAVIHYYKSR